MKAAYENDVKAGAGVTAFQTEEEARKIFPSDIDIGIDFSPSSTGGDDFDLRAYLNHDGGWAESGRTLDILLERVCSLGATVVAGKEVSGLIRKRTAESGTWSTKPKPPYRVTGVRCVDGSGFNANVVVVAAGAWTPRLIQRLGLDSLAEQKKLEADVKVGVSRHVGVGLATGYACNQNSANIEADSHPFPRPVPDRQSRLFSSRRKKPTGIARVQLFSISERASTYSR